MSTIKVSHDALDTAQTNVQPVNPKPFLQDLTGKIVNVRLKWGLEYRGFLVSTDGYMNLQVGSLTPLHDCWRTSHAISDCQMPPTALMGSCQTRRRLRMVNQTARSEKSSSGATTSCISGELFAPTRDAKRVHRLIGRESKDKQKMEED